MTNNSIVVFDTNAYRNIISQKDVEQQNLLINQIKIKENEKGIIAMMSSTVAMELIKHLRDDQNLRDFKSCASSCKIMYEHTGDSKEFRLLPLPETQISKMFFSIENKKAIKNQKTIGVILYQLSIDFNTALKNYNTQIYQITKLVDDVEQTYIDEINFFCKKIDPSFINWPLFQDNKTKRKEFLNFVKSDSFKNQTAEAMLRAVAQDLESQGETINVSEEMIQLYNQNYKIPMDFRSWVWSQFVNGNFNPQDKSRANYIWDEYILHLANQKINGNPIILVTCDKQMINAAKRINPNCLIYTFEEYLKYLEIR